MGSAILRYDFVKNTFSYDSPIFRGKQKSDIGTQNQTT